MSEDEPIREGAGDFGSPRGAAPAARDLEAQIAALAAQVRRLGERLAAPSTALPRLRIAWNRVAPAPASEPPSRASEALMAGILETAESVAAEIRASAEREAQRIRDGALLEAAARIAGLRAMIAGQRDTLGALAAEIGRLEHSATTLRSHARALDAELQAIDQALRAAAPGAN
jgi:uncharacterized coiled-coil protein SlyX